MELAHFDQMGWSWSLPDAFSEQGRGDVLWKPRQDPGNEYVQYCLPKNFCLDEQNRVR